MQDFEIYAYVIYFILIAFFALTHEEKGETK